MQRNLRHIDMRPVCFSFYIINALFLLASQLAFDKTDPSYFLSIFCLYFGQILIFLIFGFDIVFTISLLLSLMVAPSVLYFFSGIGNGDLSLNIVIIDLNSDIDYIFIYIFLFVSFSYFLKVKRAEKEIVNVPFLTNDNISIVFNDMVAIIFSVIAFPSLTLNYGLADEERFNMLLPGHAWNQLVIVALIFNLPNLDKANVKLTYLLCVSWFLIHGERADVTGLIIGIIIFTFLHKKITFIKKTFMIFGSSVLFFLLLIVGYERIEHFLPSFTELMNNIITFSTLSDVSYLLNVSVEYVKNVGNTNGQILISTIESVIPLITIEKSFGYFIEQFFPNPGGEPLISGPLMDFGKLGIIISAIVDSAIISWVVKLKTPFFKYEFIVLACSLPRIVWYGRSFVFTSMVFFVPIMYYLNQLFIQKKL